MEIGRIDWFHFSQSDMSKAKWDKSWSPGVLNSFDLLIPNMLVFKIDSEFLTLKCHILKGHCSILRKKTIKFINFALQICY